MLTSGAAVLRRRRTSVPSSLNRVVARASSARRTVVVNKPTVDVRPAGRVSSSMQRQCAVTRIRGAVATDALTVDVPVPPGPTDRRLGGIDPARGEPLAKGRRECEGMGRGWGLATMGRGRATTPRSSTAAVAAAMGKSGEWEKETERALGSGSSLRLGWFGQNTYLIYSISFEIGVSQNIAAPPSAYFGFRYHFGRRREVVPPSPPQTFQL